MGEVHDIWPNWSLSSDVKIKGSEGFPQSPFASRHVVAEAASPFDGASGMPGPRRSIGHAVTPSPTLPHQRGREKMEQLLADHSPNSDRGIRPISEPVRQVARKPAIIAFQTRLRISWRRWGTSTEKPATFMPTEPMLAKPHSA